MQGIYAGFEIDYSDTAWTCALDLVQDSTGKSTYLDAMALIISSGSAAIWKL